jgi:tetratricopeptide (TPR) repeat protein
MSYIAGNAFFWLRRSDAATDLLNRALELDPTAAYVHWIRTLLFTQQGDHARAIAGAEGALAAGRPVFLVATLGRAYARAGRSDDARLLLDELMRRRKQEYVAPMWIGDLYAALGDRPQTCDWLERAYDDRNGFLPSLLIAPEYDVLREEPRIAALIDRMHLT